MFVESDWTSMIEALKGVGFDDASFEYTGNGCYHIYVGLGGDRFALIDAYELTSRAEHNCCGWGANIYQDGEPVDVDELGNHIFLHGTDAGDPREDANAAMLLAEALAPYRLDIEVVRYSAVVSIEVDMTGKRVLRVTDATVLDWSEPDWPDMTDDNGILLDRAAADALYARQGEAGEIIRAQYDTLPTDKRTVEVS